MPKGRTITKAVIGVIETTPGLWTGYLIVKGEKIYESEDCINDEAAYNNVCDVIGEQIKKEDRNIFIS